MPRRIKLPLALLATLSFGPLALPAQTPSRTPVLVELFTSEGCSSCPPADALLLRLGQQPIPSADIIILGEHVDYWDQLGWHDRFSSHQFTQRQNQYRVRFHLESDYTPQMIVDGATQFVGNDSSRATHAVTLAASQPKIPLVLTPPVTVGHTLSATVSLPAAAADQALANANADLYASLVDPLDTTIVRNGENGGRTLHHAGVVRSLQRIGNLRDLIAAPIPVHLPLPADTTSAPQRIVVFAQAAGQGPILAAVASSN